jgi:hypothetical protein
LTFPAGDLGLWGEPDGINIGTGWRAYDENVWGRKQAAIGATKLYLYAHCFDARADPVYCGRNSHWINDRLANVRVKHSIRFRIALRLVPEF